MNHLLAFSLALAASVATSSCGSVSAKSDQGDPPPPPPTLRIVTTSLPDGTVQAPYNANLVSTGGVAPYGWSISSGHLPSGLTFDTALVAVSGIPNEAGQFNLTIMVTDSSPGSPQTASQTFSLNVAPVHSGSGSNYYVSPSGSDTNNGSAASPWRTIAHSAARVRPGDTVHVLQGVYTEATGPGNCIPNQSANCAVYTSTSGTPDNRVVFMSETRWGAQIQATNKHTAWRNTGSYVDIIGFELSGAKYFGISNSGSNVRIIGNNVHDITPGRGDCQGQGGIVTGTDNLDAQGHPLDDAHDVDTISNLVYNIGLATAGCQGRSPHGIYYGARLGHIMNNIVHHAKGYGIETWHWARGSSTSPLDISNNLVFENGYEDATGAYGGGIDVGTGDENLPNGIVADYFRLSNNIVIYNYFGLFESTDGVSRLGNNIFYRNNTVYGNSNTRFPDANLSLYDWHLDGAHLIATYTADPMLANYQSDGLGDYHLASGSPSIGSGTSLGAPGDDFDGLARPQDQPYDRGPYVWRP